MGKQKKNGKFRDRIPAFVLAAALLAAWQTASGIVNIQHIFPGPWQILKRTWELRGTLVLRQLPYTMAAALGGWAIAIVLAVAIAVLMSRSRIFEAMFYPVLIVTQTIPVMCIAPLFVLWMGYTTEARLIVVVLSTFFGITLNTFDGFRETDGGKKEMLRSMGASKAQIFFRLEVPSAFPRFLTSLRMTLPWAAADAAVAEWLGSTRGLGYFSRRMIIRMDGPAVFAPILILCIVTVLGMVLLNAADRRFAAYRSEL
ncbi:MAG: ABC transporter permease [Eubacteriales bacterium]|nr:ABC transporter permease [Eubacteriales bacterium]